MARNYRELTRGAGLWVPRWVVLAACAAGLLWLGFTFLVPPSWMLQRLDSPDGTRSARLLRSLYLKPHLAVQIRESVPWTTVYYSPPIPADFRADLGERLAWTPDSTTLFLRLTNRVIWARDFSLRRDLTETERAALAGGPSEPFLPGGPATSPR